MDYKLIKPRAHKVPKQKYAVIKLGRNGKAVMRTFKDGSTWIMSEYFNQGTVTAYFVEPGPGFKKRAKRKMQMLEARARMGKRVPRWYGGVV